MTGASLGYASLSWSPLFPAHAACLLPASNAIPSLCRQRLDRQNVFGEDAIEIQRAATRAPLVALPEIRVWVLLILHSHVANKLHCTDAMESCLSTCCAQGPATRAVVSYTVSNTCLVQAWGPDIVWAECAPSFVMFGNKADVLHICVVLIAHMVQCRYTGRHGRG